MKIRLLRHFREGLKNLIRNGWMTFASLSAVGITLLILGVTLVIAMNAQQMSNYITGQLQINVFYKMTATTAQEKQTMAEIQSMPGVKSVQFVSKQEEFAQLQKSIGSQYNDVLSGLSATNTLPDKLVVKAVDPRQTVTLGTEIATMPQVDKVQDGSDVANKLFRFLDVVRNIGLAFVVGLVVTAMFLISNTIKITIFSRRREIEIMRLVGATNWFIRWPFLTEGLMIGAIGAAVPFLAIFFAYRMAYERIGGAFLSIAFPLMPVAGLASKLALVLFGLGLFIGIWGGIMSVRKFLRV
ncbi:ABC transporter permease [Alicyclobacillus curvatus]|jgi:cell division transport system permease protein|nr:ABC transporter permease [Alicyclobacillus curvatus]